MSQKIHVLLCTLEFFLHLETILSALLKVNFKKLVFWVTSTETASKMFGYVLLCTLPHIFSSFLLLTSNSKFFEEGAGEFENTVFFALGVYYTISIIVIIVLYIKNPGFDQFG